VEVVAGEEEAVRDPVAASEGAVHARKENCPSTLFAFSLNTRPCRHITSLLNRTADRGITTTTR
jgi:hypothetical protein